MHAGVRVSFFGYSNKLLCIPNLSPRTAGKIYSCFHLLFFLFFLQMVIPGDVAEMTEFQEKTMNNSRFIVELCFSNVQLVLPSKAFYEKLHNRYSNGSTVSRCLVLPMSNTS